MSFFSRLRTEAAHEWQVLLDHPFPRKLVNGSLSKKKFHYYLSQDDYYLDELLAALGMVVARTNHRNVRFFAVRLLHGTVEGEVVMHEALEREGGFHRYPTGRCAREYGRFLFFTALRGNERDFFTALAPCVVSYREIAVLRRREAGPNIPDIYRMWLEAYLDDSYQVLVREYIDMLDSLAAGMTDAAYARALALFLQGCRFEYAFWEESETSL